MNKKMVLGLMLLLTVVMCLSSVNAGLFDLNTNSNDIEVSNLKIESEGYSMYDVNCDLTPKKDFTYLEMYVIFYNADGAVLEKNNLVWNTNNPAKDQLIKVSGSAFVRNNNEKPVRAEVYFTDSALESNPENALYVENVTMS
jgi:hypothetical protein